MRFALVAIVCELSLCPLRAEQDTIQTHAARARQAQERRDFVAAANEWQAVVDLAPHLAEARSNLGMMWHFAGNYEKSIPELRAAAKLNSALVAPHLFLGIDLYLTSHPGEAIPQLEKALQIEPDNALARKWLSMSDFQVGNFSRAALSLSRAARLSPSDLDLQFFLSRVCSKLLFQSYERIKSLDAKSPYPAALRETGSPVALRGTGSTVALSETGSPSSRVDPALLKPVQLLKEGKANDALPILVELVGRRPTTDNWYWLGKTAQHLALSALDTYLSADGTSYRVHQLQAEYALASGDDDKAAAEYRQALAVNPGALQIHLELGDILVARHDTEGAIPEYEAELRQDPYSVSALQRIGQAYADLHEPRKAEPYLTKALEIQPGNPDALRAMGKVKMETGDYSSAARYLTGSLRAGAKDNSLFFQLSKAYRALGDNAQADRWLTLFRREMAAERDKAEKGGAVSTVPSRTNVEAR